MLGWLEAAALVAFAVSIVWNAQQVHSTVGKPLAEAVIYVLFATMFATATWFLQRGSSAARTPFGLLQAFVVIAGYTFLSGTGTAVKTLGVVVAIVGAVGFIALLRDRPAR